jgi:hypothetical protein
MNLYQRCRFCLGLLLLMSVVATVRADLLGNAGTSIKGVLTVNQMMEGQLLRLKGRVGQGHYIGIDYRDRYCSIELPVAIGSTTDTNIGIRTTDGVKIVVTSQKLSDAILRGERIVSSDWVFRSSVEGISIHAENGFLADGYIIHGIGTEEGFVVNARRKWISWFLGGKPMLWCQ